MTSVPTLKSLSAVKVAIAICTNANVKKEVFRMPGSHYVLNVAEWLLKEKGSWDGLTESAVTNIMKDVALSQSVLEILSFHVHLVVQNAWKWFRYLAISFGFGQDYLRESLKGSFFTSSGNLDRRAAASEMVRDERMNMMTRLKLAFLFLPVENFSQLWGQVDEKDQYHYVAGCCRRREREISLERLVSDLGKASDKCITDRFDVNCIMDELWNRLFRGVVESISDIGVKYYWQKLDPCSRHLNAVSAFDYLQRKAPPWWYKDIFFKTYWAECVAEILSFLLSQMEDDQKVSILQEDFERNGKQTVLLSLLNKYCEDGFLDMVRLSWSLLRESDFHSLLQQMVLLILRLRADHLKCQYVTSCDNRKLLRKFWKQSPSSLKSAAIKWSTFEDAIVFVSLVENSEMDLITFLLKDATLQEKVALMFSGKSCLIFQACKHTDTKLANELLDCISLCPTERQECLQKEINHILSDSSVDTICESLNTFYKFVQFCLQFEDELTKVDLRRRIVREMSIEIVERLLDMNKIEEVNSFLLWCFSTPEEITDFRAAFLKHSPDLGSKLMKSM